MNTNSTTATDHIVISPPSNIHDGKVKSRASQQLKEGQQLKDAQQLKQAEQIKETTGLKETSKNKVSKEEADKIVETLYELTDMLKTSLTFKVDEKTDSVVIKVIDKKSNEIIRQIPNEDILALREKMEEMTGILLREKA